MRRASHLDLRITILLVSLTACGGSSPPNGAAIPSTAYDAEVTDGAPAELADADLGPASKCFASPLVCSSLTGDACRGTPGCATQPACAGAATDCAELPVEDVCDAQLGCVWNAQFNQCTGTPATCRTLGTMLCARQRGCGVVDDCVRVSGSTCYGFTRAECESNAGCEWGVPAAPDARVADGQSSSLEEASPASSLGDESAPAATSGCAVTAASLTPRCAECVQSLCCAQLGACFGPGDLVTAGTPTETGCEKIVDRVNSCFANWPDGGDAGPTLAACELSTHYSTDTIVDRQNADSLLECMTYWCGGTSQCGTSSEARATGGDQ